MTKNKNIIIVSLAVAVVYFIIAWLGWLLVFEEAHATPVWIPSGLALTALLIYGKRTWWGIALGAMAAGLPMLLKMHHDLFTVLWVSVITCIGVILEAFTGYYFLRKNKVPANFFHSPEGVLRFAFVGMLMCLVGAVIGPAVSFGAGLITAEQFPLSVITWWLGDLAGIYVITPLIIIWANNFRSRLTSNKAIELLFLSGGLTLILGILFLGWFDLNLSLIRTYLILPFLVWVSLRFSQREVISVITLVAMVCVIGTARGSGPFVGNSVFDSLLALTAYITIISVAFLVLSSAIVKQLRSMEEIETARFINQLTDASPDFIGVFDVLKEKVTYTNKKFRDFYRFSDKDEIDYDRVWESVHPEDIPKLKKFIEKFIRMKTGEVENMECRITGNTGKIHWINSIATLLERNPEAGTGMLIVSRDVTIRKNAEEMLHDSEDQIKTIFQNAPEAVIVIDEHSRIMEWNPFAEKIFGWNKEEAIGKYLHELIIPEEYREAHVLGLKKYLDTGEGKVLSRQIEMEALKKDHSRFDAGLNISPLKYRGKQYFIGFLADITPRKKADAELKKKSEELAVSNQDLEQFAYVASHDLQEPLRMVSSYVQLLENRYKDKLDQDARDFIHFAIEGTNRMRNLINSLLEYSRINRPRPFEKINTTRLLTEVTSNLKQSIDESKARVVVGDIPEINGDPGLIAQLFQNLVSNAIKFRSSTPPEIEISGTDKEGEWLFSVKDNGIGIKKEYHHKIFVIFQRLHTKEQYPGTGIGLAVCKKIVERHGGKIRVESDEGKGSTFYFTLKKNKYQ